jgi:hypothetical protein
VGETTWTHLGIVAVPAVMIVAMWLDNRRSRHEEETRASERHEQEAKIASTRHQDNIQRLASIETKIEPMWKAWNDRRFQS